MSQGDDRHSVTVQIAGDDHTLRTNADPDYTRRCAELVDERITQILRHIGPVPTDRAAILAALSLADEWLQAREQHSEAEAELVDRIVSITSSIDAGSSKG